jgi:alpha-tubulin suppressor-like RCC1 family protein
MPPCLSRIGHGLPALAILLALASCDSGTSDPPSEDGPFVASAITAGDAHACMLTAEGQAYCWGDNTWRQLGDASTAERRTSPVAVSGTVRFSDIEAGNRYTCALAQDGRAYCWGDNVWGQLGSPESTTGCSFGMPCRVRPTPVEGAPTFASLAAGYNHVCGLTGDGRAYCWGENGQGQLGREGFEHAAPPREVSGGHRFASLTAGGFHTCGVKADGQAWCWGANMWGQAGVGSGEVHPAPVAVAGGRSFSALSGGRGHTCGRTTGGEGYCWGENQHGQLGTGSTGDPRLTPAAVAGGLTFASISAGDLQTCGVTTQNQAFCWGTSLEGGLGAGGTTQSATPVAVGGGIAFAEVSAFAASVCGRTTGGEVYCWGANDRGQLGRGTPARSATPVRVGRP